MLPFRAVPVLFLSGVAACATVAAAQPAPSAAAQSTPAPAAVLHSSTNLVLLDVIVTKGGKAVQTLDRSHFHVFENGREQAITVFDEHQPTATPAASAEIRAKLAALPANVYTNIPVYPEAAAKNVLLLDGLNTLASDQMEVRRQMLQFIGTIRPGTSLAIFTLSSHLRQLSGFTTDPATLTKALKSQNAGAYKSGLLDPEWDKAINRSTAEFASQIHDRQIIQNMVQFQADTKAYETDQRVNMTLEAFGNLARYLSAIPGRKNLIWFSSSFPIALDPDTTLVNPFKAMRNYSLQIQETSDLLAAARVAVYPVDARGLLKMPSLDASNSSEDTMQRGSAAGMRPSSAAPTESAMDAQFTREVMEERSAMQLIAGATGGKAFINTNGFNEAVASAIDNGSNYYTIGYVPTAGGFDGQFHKFQVRIDDHKYQLAYRRGYYADAPDKPTRHATGVSSLMNAALLHGAPQATQVLFDAQVLPASDPGFQSVKLPDGPAGEMAAQIKGPSKRYVVSLIVSTQGLAYQQMPDGSREGKIELVLMAYDAQGKHVNYAQNTYASSVKPGQPLPELKSGIRLRLTLDMPAGENALRIAVHDLVSDRIGSLEIPVTVPAK